MRLTLLPGGSQTFDIKRIGSRVALGRKEGSDIIINEPVVSGTHCYITVVSRSEATIEDSSTNGTYINGVKVGKGSRLSVHDGDMLTLGKPGTATGPIGTGVCVNFRVSFEMDLSPASPPAAAPMPLSAPTTSSMAYKQDIEDFKVLVSQGEHRNDVLSAKNAELSTKMLFMDNEMRKIKEDNIELTVRNDSMKSEIDSLRLRMAQADSKVDAAERRADGVQAKLAMLEKECAEIALLRAEYKLTTSLREEMERLRRRNTELTAHIQMSNDVRRMLTTSLEAIHQQAGNALRGATEDHADNSSAGTVMSPAVIRNITKPKPRYPEYGIESAPAAPKLALEDSPKAAKTPSDLLQ